ncbi:hypothetical protein GEV27_04195 [Aeromicrobium sp. S22]|uniref:hypothetical protein n=1 Tax=Aeromicrobium sp. S22 TaxID=2662029 RepID=UPI00129D700F|nr:hypothetical protein [Aeromicrobium sp. S22]MRK00717.1 hypothetical protein [Aeromicrobium sp. S22]
METLTLTELARRMGRRWVTLLAGAGAGLALGLATHIVLPTRYEAVAVLRIDGPDPARIDMAAEEALASSRRVTAEARDALGESGLSIRELEDAVSATTVKESRVLQVSYAADDPRRAARAADAVANAYLAVRAVDARRLGGRAASTAEVIDPARTPTAPLGPGRPTSALGGLALGLLLAAPVSARPTARTRAGRAS